MAERTTGTATTTTVRHIAKPRGPERRQGPHLGDLRAFLAECEDLPDDLQVHIDRKAPDGDGRRCVEIRTHLRVPIDVAPPAPVPPPGPPPGPPRPVPGPRARRAS